MFRGFLFFLKVMQDGTDVLRPFLKNVHLQISELLQV